jgi:hypothetical protein
METIASPVAQNATWNLNESATTALRNLCAIAGAKGFVTISATKQRLSLMAQSQKYTTDHCLWSYAPDGCTPGAVTLTASALSRAIVKKGAISITLQNKTVRVTSGEFIVSLTPQPDVFPYHQAFPSFHDASALAMIDDWHPVRDAMTTAAAFASCELARGALLNGTHLQFAPKTLWNEDAGEETLGFTATDGPSLRHVTVPVRIITAGGGESAVMPAELIAAMKKLKIARQSRAVGTLAIAKGWILAEVYSHGELGSYLFRHRAIDGTYPNVAWIMPAEYPSTVCGANVKEFAEALRNAIAFRKRTERVGRYDCVETRIEQAGYDSRLQVSHGDWSDTVFCQNAEAWHKSAWNAQLLLRAIESLDTHWFSIAQKKPLEPAILWDPYTKNGFAMVMPLRIDAPKKAKGAK